jgi:hypothetical protein
MPSRAVLIPALLIALALPASGTAEVAQGQRRPAPGLANPGASDRPGRPVRPAPKGAACVAWCPYDTSPCDPWYFKQADNRCGFEGT